MKKRVLKLLLMGISYTSIGLFSQLLLVSFLYASEVEAQEIRSVKDVLVEIEANDEQIVNVFQAIETDTDFKFVYDKEDKFLQSRLDFSLGKTTVENILLEISKQQNLSFRQINNNISVKKTNRKSKTIEIVIQGITISGKVTTSEDESGLPGVNVIVKGTSRGTVTDIEGNYVLEVPDGNTVLVFSSVGYLQEEVAVREMSTINMTLSPDITSLDEIVVIGYGTRKKSDLTGAVSQIGEEEIVKGSTMTPEMALQGQMAGVYVTSPGTDPNARPTIRIRGVSTLGNNDPLFVIDGVPITEFGRETMNPFAMINPNDIESISVLKDASATAIYGVRASNGVILIQTKRGSKGKVNVSMTASYGVQNIKERYDVLPTQEYVSYMREALENNTVTTLDPKWKALYIEDPSFADGYYLGDTQQSYDWQNVMLNTNAPVQDYNLSISGGNDVSNYAVSAGFANQESAFKGNDLDRYSIAINSDHQIKSWLKAGQTLRYAITNRDYPGLETDDSRPVAFLTGVAPWMPVYSADGPNGFTSHNRTLADGSEIIGQAYGQATADHPLGQMSMVKNVGLGNRLLGSAYAQVEPLPGLKFKGTVSLDWGSQQTNYLESEDIGFFKTWGFAAPNGNTYRDKRTTNRNLVKEVSIIYNKSFGRHNIDAIVNGMDQSIFYEYLEASQIHFPFFDLNMRGIQASAPADDKITQSYNQRYALQGYMGRLSYNFSSKYYLDATVRRDGSSNFAPGYKWGTFPSFAGAWRISSESFMGGMNWINDLKLRGGWGKTGNQETSAFSYISLMNINPSYATGSGAGVWPDDNLNPGAYAAQFPVEDLSWETVTTTSFGFDGIFFNNKIELTAEYYERFTDDILQTANLTLSTGIPNNPKINLAQVSNKGFEFVLGYHDQFGDFNLDITSNLTTVKNNVEKLFVDQPGGVEEGFPINYIYGYVMEGIFQTQGEVDEYINTMVDNGKMNQLAPGDIRFADLYGPPVEGGVGKEEFKSFEPDNKVDNYDQTYLGKLIPGYFYGLNLAASYKQWDLSFTFRGIGDVQKINSDRQRQEDMRANGANQFTSIRDRWTSQNPSTTMPRAIYNDPSDNRRFSSRWVEDGKFFRLDNVQLGYNLPVEFLDKVNLQGGRVALTATNLFVLTPYTGIDPETLIPTSVRLGLNLNF